MFALPAPLLVRSLAVSDTKEFKKNPQNYLKHHRVMLAELTPDIGEFGFMEELVAANQYKMKQLLYLDFEIKKGGDTSLGVKKIEIGAAGVADTGLRVLPWKQDCLTYMKLDDSARFFLTGPIEGCYIYVARSPIGAVYVFHVNANAVTGMTNVQAKDNAVQGILTAKNLQLTQRLAYADYNQTGFVNKGFVYGWKDGTNWRFHVHSLSLIGKSVTTKQGYVTFQAKRFDKYKASEALPAKTTL
jgi:hypothetical protein